MKEQHDILTGMLNCTEAASILLAMTTSLADENALKELLQKQGYKFAVTELGGDASKSEFREKMTRSIIGACLNCSVISKTAQEKDPLWDAAWRDGTKGSVICDFGFQKRDFSLSDHNRCCGKGN